MGLPLQVQPVGRCGVSCALTLAGTGHLESGELAFCDLPQRNVIAHQRVQLTEVGPTLALGFDDVDKQLTAVPQPQQNLHVLQAFHRGPLGRQHGAVLIPNGERQRSPQGDGIKADGDEVHEVRKLVPAHLRAKSYRA